jgi:hypothetical protein
MSRWVAKAAVQRVIGLLPRSYFWNTLFQTHVTRSMDLTSSRLEGRLRRCARHLSAFANHTLERDEKPATALEIGTGWYPIVPLGLFLCGVDKIWTYDIAALLSGDRVRETMRQLAEAADNGLLQDLLPSYSGERLDRLRSAADSEQSRAGDLLSPLGVEYVIRDASYTGLEPASVDLIFSNVSLEYVPHTRLEKMLAEFRRIISPRGVMSHEIDLADQYAGFDHSITQFNFLKFSDRVWHLINNPLIPLNRLRIADYRELIVGGDFQIVAEDLTNGTVAELATVQLAPRFRAYAEDDLLVTGAWIVATPAGNEPASAAPR